jgi:hypothetical protein
MTAADFSERMLGRAKSSLLGTMSKESRFLTCQRIMSPEIHAAVHRSKRGLRSGCVRQQSQGWPVIITGAIADQQIDGLLCCAVTHVHRHRDHL